MRDLTLPRRSCSGLGHGLVHSAWPYGSAEHHWRKMGPSIFYGVMSAFFSVGIQRVCVRLRVHCMVLSATVIGICVLSLSVAVAHFFACSVYCLLRHRFHHLPSLLVLLTAL